MVDKNEASEILASEIKLDSADKKILLALINNSRLPVSVIAKQTHLSREIVSYRMSKLEEENIITGYIARINQPLFCSGIAMMSCKLTRSSIARFKEITAFIQKHPSVNWCIETCGTSDLSLTILYNTPKDLADTVTELSNFIGQNLRKHEISLYIDEYKFDRSGLITEKPVREIKHAPVTFNKKQSLNLDSIDIGLLKILSRNCRTKNIIIAEELKISEDVVRLRIKSLEKRNIITGYTLSVNADKLGYAAYQMFLTIENMTNEAVNKVKYYAHTNPYIVFCARTSGKHNIVMNINAKNRQHFSNILLEIRNALPEIINYEFQLDMKTHKEVFVPEQKLKERA
jgi:Lrp/AsnC family transcriptional regulator for asnA, asnC and gidA